MKMKRLIKKIKTGTLERNFTLNRDEIDEENRTVPIAFSSEEPVERWFGTEILSHDAKHVRLGRMNDGAPLLVDHDSRDHVGTIEEATIDTDKTGRALVRFGSGTRASEVFQDVLDGIRKHISVGYRIHKMEEDRDTGEFRAIDWEPFECSFVSIPADNSVGVMRNSDNSDNFETDIITYEDRTMDFYDKDGNKVDENGKRVAPDVAAKVAPAPKVDTEAVIKAARKDELSRIAEITALGKEHGQDDLANTAISDGSTVNKMRANVLDTLKDSKPAPSPAGEIGLTQKEVKRFSYCRALNALSNPSNPKAQEAAAFEIECSNAVANERGIDSQGFFVPEMNNNGFVNTRSDGVYVPGVSIPHEVQYRADLSTAAPATGGDLVDTTLMSGSFIDVLRKSSAIVGMGATVMTGLNGDIAIPGKLAAGTSAWLATEGADAVQKDMTFRQVALTPKTAATFTEYTRQLLMQSSLDIDNLIRNDIVAGMALLIDAAALYGTANNGQPRGIANTTGIGDPTIWAAHVPTWGEVVALESNVAGSEALMGQLGYLMETSMRGSLKTVEKASNTAQFIMGEGGELNGYRGNVSNQVTSGDIFFGNFADLLIGMWGGMDLLIDPYSNSLSGTIRVVAHQSVDVAVRHAGSFALGNNNV